MNLPKPYYHDERAGITIYNADCRDILPHLDPVDLVLTDPPFEVEAHTLQRRVQRGAGVMKIEALPFAQITEDVRLESAKLMAALCKKWVLTFCQIEGAPAWRSALEAAGHTYKRTCIWVKPDGMPQYSGDRPGMGYETFVAMHGPGKSTWHGGGASRRFHRQQERRRWASTPSNNKAAQAHGGVGGSVFNSGECRA